MKNFKLISLALILFFFSLLLLNHFFGFTGPFGFDDIEYARLGHLYATGNSDYTNPFTFRFGVILPVGYLQNIFGITDSSAAIYPLLLSLILILTVYKSSNLNWKTAFIALAILFCCPWIVFYSDKIGADIPVTVYMIVAIYIFYQSRFGSSSKNRIFLYGMLFSSVLFIAFLTKETVWFLMPLLVIFLIYDVFKKQNFRFWIIATLTILVLMFGYSLWQKIQFNDWFYRFKLIKMYDNTNICSYDRQPFSIVFKRITTELWTYFMAEGTFLIPIILLIATLHKQNLSAPFAKQNFWATVSIILILSANFWTISYNSYHPLCVDIRHYLYIFPVCAIAIANNYEMLFRRWSVILVLLVSILILAFKNQLQLKEVSVVSTYIILIIFTFLLFIKKGKVYVLLAIVLIPLSHLYLQISNASQYDYQTQEEIARDFLKDKRQTTIYTSRIQERFFKYYLGFEVPKDLSIVSYSYFNQLKKGYHYWNYHSTSLSQQFNAIPTAIQAVSIPQNQIKNSDIIKIYRIDRAVQNIQTYNLSSSFFNVQFKKDETAYILPNQEYGPTFRKTIAKNVHQINVSSNWLITNKSLKDASLVFSLEEDGKLLYYQTYSIKTDRAAYNNKYKLFKAVNISKIKINKEAVLKVYIWNNQEANLNISKAEIVLALD